jgi:DnaD/phage-associated family protein
MSKKEKDAYYFSHDQNARNDPKIMALRTEYGMEGYGLYWVIVEMLRESKDFKLPHKKYVYNAIGSYLQCKSNAIALQNDANVHTNYAKEFLHFCIEECELFESDDQFFWSNSLIGRMDKKKEVSEKRRAAAKARWEKSNNGAVSEDSEMQNDANAMQMDANAMQSDAIKVKERKVNINNNNNNNNNNKTAEIIKFWDINGFGINHIVNKEKLLSYLDSFEDPGVVLKALEIASEQNKTSYSYVSKVLNDWINRGVKDLEDVQALQKEYEQAKAKRTGSVKTKKLDEKDFDLND